MERPSTSLLPLFWVAITFHELRKHSAPLVSGFIAVFELELAGFCPSQSNVDVAVGVRQVRVYSLNDRSANQLNVSLLYESMVLLQQSLSSWECIQVSIVSQTNHQGHDVVNKLGCVHVSRHKLLELCVDVFCSARIDQRGVLLFFDPLAFFESGQLHKLLEKLKHEVYRTLILVDVFQNFV